MKIAVETDCLILRADSPDDAPAFYELNSNPEVVRYTGGDRLGSVEEARQGIRERIMHDYAVHGFGRWAMISLATRFAAPHRRLDAGRIGRRPERCCGCAAAAVA